VPKAYHGILHPVLVTAVVANAGLALQGKLLGISYNAAQTAYLAKVGGASQTRAWAHTSQQCTLCLNRGKTHMQSAHIQTDDVRDGPASTGVCCTCGHQG
jgi:hypothetical protein